MMILAASALLMSLVVWCATTVTLCTSTAGFLPLVGMAHGDPDCPTGVAFGPGASHLLIMLAILAMLATSQSAYLREVIASLVARCTPMRPRCRATSRLLVITTVVDRYTTAHGGTRPSRAPPGHPVPVHSTL